MCNFAAMRGHDIVRAILIVLFLCQFGWSDPGSIDYRLSRCAAYRQIPYDGDLRVEWSPYVDPTDPCSLRCRDLKLGLSVVLEAQVPDGTTCRNRTVNDVCRGGRCLTPGCDGQLGSGLEADRCGVCGGNGSSCRPSNVNRNPGSSTKQRVPSVDWYQTNFSACPVSCGVGVQTTQVICREKRTQRVVDHSKCDVTTKPEIQMRNCRVHCDQHVWIGGAWSQCSRSCGGGVKHRPVFCVAEQPDGSFERQKDSTCGGKKPEVNATCNEAECPQWISGEWSTCSSTCSIGIQMRAVVCRKLSGIDCPSSERPMSRRPCHSGVSCSQTTKFSDVISGSEYDTGELRGRGDYFEFDLDQPEADDRSRASTTPATARGHGQGRPDPRHRERARHTLRHEESRRSGSGPRKPHVLPPPPTPQQHLGRHVIRRPEVAPARIEQDRFTGSGDTERQREDLSASLELQSRPVGENREVTTTPGFVAASWGPCSAVCGTGVRTRIVNCQVYNEISISVQVLPDSSCSGEKPVDSEYCEAGECIGEAVRESYAWSLTGYGTCSRTCAGGTQDAVFQCLRVSDMTMTKNDKCKHLPLPQKPPQSCNEERCPPRWRAFPLTLCSASCGGGQQHRKIRCIYDLDNGDIEEVSDDRCPPPKPQTILFCNMAPCLPTWNMDSWSKCSVTCGRGIQERQVRCEQKHSLLSPVVVNDSLCAEYSTPPPSSQPCTMDPCPRKSARRPRPVIEKEDSSFVQLPGLGGRVPLHLLRSAQIIPNSSIQIPCPVRNFNRSLIVWYHNNATIGRTGRVKVSPKGLLRIRKSRISDAGIYTCEARGELVSINISFHSQQDAETMVQARRISVAPYNRQTDKQDDEFEDGEEQKDPISLKHLLKNQSVHQTDFRFHAHPWSACSKTCGGSGLQSRDITCEVMVGRRYTLVVADEYCLDKGHRKPIETQDCGYGSSALTCPTWKTGQWSECTEQSCHRNGFGSRTRSVYCLGHNGTIFERSSCSQDTRPSAELECEHENCLATWRAADWSKCSLSCGGKGTKTRDLDCVWSNNQEKAPVSECESLETPETTGTCNMPACPEPTGCRDESKYCNLIPKLHMCRFPQYKRECCLSCNFVSNSGQTMAVRSQQYYVV